MDWLDTETKALLERSPPEKLAPPDTATFTLMLLDVCSRDRQSLVEALQHAVQATADQVARILDRRLPIAVKHGLTYTDAQIAQFELICCDAVSVILADAVVATASPLYLADLYTQLRNIDEFQPITVRVEMIPDDAKGQAFCDRFFNGRRPNLPAVGKFMRKKARIMEHWATKIGGHVSVSPLPK